MTEKEKDKTSEKDKEKKKEEEILPEKGSDESVLTRRGYKLDKKIGEGSYGRVYLASFKNPRNQKSVKLACKVIDANKAPENFVKKFLPREIEAMRKLRHQNLIRIHSMMERKNRYYIFLQYADRGDLLEFLKEKGGLVEKQAKIWFNQLLKGVEYLHKAKYAHRDLKCENLLLAGDYEIKISDFGFARKWSPKMDHSKTYCGSPSYSPPEIVSGTPYKPMPADIWSCGVILFVMMNKSMPFDYKNKKLMVELQAKKAYKFRPKVKERVTPELVEIVSILLEPIPDRRPTALDLLKDKWFNEMPVTRGGLTSGTVVTKKNSKKSQELATKDLPPTSPPAAAADKKSRKESIKSPNLPTTPTVTAVQKPPPPAHPPPQTQNHLQPPPAHKGQGHGGKERRKSSPAPHTRKASPAAHHNNNQAKKTSHPKNERKVSPVPQHPPQQRRKSSAAKKARKDSHSQPPVIKHRRNTKGAIMGGEHKGPPKPLPLPVEAPKEEPSKKKRFSLLPGGGNKERRKSSKRK